MLVKRRSARSACVLALAGLAGCTGSSDPSAGAPTPTPTPVAEGLTRTDNGWTFHTSDFTLEPGQERFLCYSVTTPDDMAIGRFASEAHPFIHHFLFATAI